MSKFRLHSWQCFSLFFILFPNFTQADYYVDDGNGTVVYASIIGAQIWHHLDPAANLTFLNGSALSLDFSRLYNQTMTFTACDPSQNCQIEIPFTGSGITVHGVLLPGVTNITISLDGRTAPAPPGFPQKPDLSPATYNVTMYDIQSLPLAFHVLTITLVDWYFPQHAGYSLFGLDYAYINETEFSPNSASNLRSHFPTGNVIGGTIAALVVVSTVIIVLLHYKRKLRTSLRTDIDAEPNDTALRHSGSVSQPHYIPQPFMVHGPTPLSTRTARSSNQPSNAVLPQQHGQPILSSSAELPNSSAYRGIGIDPNESRFGLGFLQTKGHRRSHRDNHGSDSSQNVFNSEVQAPAIPRVMSGGLLDSQPAGSSLSGHGHQLPSTAPPSYEAANPQFHLV